MMHASRTLTSAQATHYYETEYSRGDYYTRGEEELPGYWHGRGAEELGLHGPVQSREFSALLGGLHPRTREPLVPARLGLDTRRAAVSLEKLGYRVDVARKNEVKILGITDEQRTAFSTRRAEILAWCERNRTAPARKGQEAAHATRLAKKRGVNREEVSRAWKERAKDLGIDLPGLRPGVRERVGRLAQAVGLKERLDIPTRARQAVAIAIEHVSERRSILKLDLVEQAALQWSLGEGVRLKDIRDALRDRTDLQFSKDGLRLTTDAAQANEWALLRRGGEGRGKASPVQSKPDLLNRGLSAEQCSAAKLILGSRDWVMGLEGKAGTGKSYVLQEIAREALHAGWYVRGFAPTGRAAEVLAAAGIKAQTVESLLRERDARTGGRQLWIVDEAGLLDSRRARALLEKASDLKARVLLVGDRAQHRAVEAGVPYAQLVDAGMKTAKLTQIQRQRNPSLREVVEHLSERRVAYAVRLLDERGRIREFEHRKDRHAAVAKDYCERPSGALVIAPSNAERTDLNHRIREELKRAGVVDRSEVHVEVFLSRGLTKAEKRDVRTVVLEPMGSSQGRGGGSSRWIPKRGVSGSKWATVRSPSTRNASGPSMWVASRHGPSPLRTGSRFGRTSGSRGSATELWVRFTGSTQQGRGPRSGWTMEGPSHSISSLPRPWITATPLRVTRAKGETVDRVLVVVDTRHGSTLVNQRQAYVSVSRARDDVMVYTDDRRSLVRAWGRDSTGDQRAIDLDPIRPEVREWQRAAQQTEREASVGLRTRHWNREGHENSFHESRQRQRTDIDPEVHYDQVQAMEKLRRAALESRSDRGPLWEAYAAQRSQVYELRHGRDRSNLGPQPRLTEREELHVHYAQRTLGKDSPVTRDFLERLDSTQLKTAAGKLHDLAQAHERLRQLPGVPGLRREVAEKVRAVKQSTRVIGMSWEK